MNYYIDEIIDKLIEMRIDGYRYCEITEFEENEEDSTSACLFFSGLECGGLGACDYGEVNSISNGEISHYAQLNEEAPKHRIELNFADNGDVSFFSSDI